MKNNIKILFATDFSRESKNALKIITKLKEQFDLSIYFIHAICSSWKNWFTSGIYEKEARQRLQTWQQRFDSIESDESQLIIEKRSPADAIISNSERLNVDLIVLGAENHVTGTTASVVVRSASRPVLLCKTEVIKNVICGIDLSEASAIALEFAIDICNRFNAGLTIIHVLSKPDFNPLGMLDEEVEENEEKFKQEIIDNAETFYQRFDFNNLNVKKVYPWGKPSRVIIEMAEDFDYDLIVIGPTGENKVSQVLMGTTAEKILRNTPCSLLIVR